MAVEGTGRPVGIDHKCASTRLAACRRPLAMCIYGHHGGLPALADLQNELRAAAPELIRDWEATVAGVVGTVPEIAARSASPLPAWAVRAWCSLSAASEDRSCRQRA